MIEITVKTRTRTEAREITAEVAQAVRGSAGGKLVHVYTPHTTCGIAINENADPAVMKDILDGLGRMVPQDFPYRHREGNSDAHIKSTLTGCAVSVPCVAGALKIGVWQGIFLMEFDGPRERKVFITLM